MALAHIVERQGVGHGFWVMLAGSFLANAAGQAIHLFAIVAQGQASVFAGIATVAVDVVVIAAVVALLEARRRSGLESAEPVIWPVIIAPLAAGWIMALIIALWPGDQSAQPGAIQFFLINHPFGLALQAAIACALVWRYAVREGALGFFPPIAALAIGVAVLAKLSLAILQNFPLLGGPNTVVVAAVGYVILRRATNLGFAFGAADEGA